VTFVDTSVWYGAVDLGDVYNERARELLANISDPLLTDHVLIESWRLVNSKIHRKAAEGFWFGIRSGVAELERVTASDLDIAWAIGESFPDQNFSIVDRTSFAVMERLGVTQAASFDDHFAIYRYGSKRDRAFEILR
jgi:uncharacterized protein